MWKISSLWKLSVKIRFERYRAKRSSGCSGFQDVFQSLPTSRIKVVTASIVTYLRPDWIVLIKFADWTKMSEAISFIDNFENHRESQCRLKLPVAKLLDLDTSVALIPSFTDIECSHKPFTTSHYAFCLQEKSTAKTNIYLSSARSDRYFLKCIQLFRTWRVFCKKVGYIVRRWWENGLCC